VFQLIVMIIYVAYGGWWVVKAKRDIVRSGKDIQKMLYALTAASACIIARGIFRTVELDEGFGGYLAVRFPSFSSPSLKSTDWSFPETDTRAIHPRRCDPHRSGFVHSQVSGKGSFPLFASQLIIPHVFGSDIHPAKYLVVDKYAATPEMTLDESTSTGTPVDPQLREKSISAGNV